ncbi:AraC-like DNA-binding protein/mannose-6-phosphate isomerase-like protein (cupin superfamily) [Paenibacillus turicensis]|uniref:AraC-like DNA-binding protein/mannose-6-phosphate isomerase-like protein (Cupin superfamily) n=1 Tax=Paenibacillus turicensis TaxID=160487 RepID=A0ABS4FMG5_9BACL|nr:AraC family transcriptional regulator [Paenibacillus turicensis]MBP1903768.1 AraC-like DNA-binding protein/mannose-6-phosphate isomerase-like protein (cupin superfamily) [Paenibacillus turicensis]
MLDTRYTDSELKENVTHVTFNRPYSIHYTHIPANTMLGLYQHWHEEIEFLYVEQGELELVIEDTHIQLQAGEAVLIPQNLLHYALNTYNKEISFYAFLFSPVLFTEAFSHASYARFVQPLTHHGSLYICHLTGSQPWQNDALLFLKKIISFYNREDIDKWELELHGLLYQLWNLYFNHHIRNIELSNAYIKLHHKLKLSMEYIHDHIYSDLSLELLANQADLNKSTFCRYFKQLTGLSPFTYIVQQRIRKSCEALLNSESKITEIATQCGFYNISYFNRAFLQYMKCTPSEYRKQYQMNR